MTIPEKNVVSKHWRELQLHRESVQVIVVSLVPLSSLLREESCVHMSEW